MTPVNKRCGFVAILGRPNVGKSTLLNRLVGEKLAGVSAKPQTTRGVVRGILNRSEGQIVFLDTPGFHDPHDSLGSWMLKEVDKSIGDADLLYLMVIPGKPHSLDQKIFKKIEASGRQAILLVNQVDRFPKPAILPALEHYQSAHVFKEWIPISAMTGDQIEVLIQKTLQHLPEGHPYFPEDQISDQQERYFVQEMIREKIFRQTGAEIPYASSVVIDTFKEREDGLIQIEATVYVERDSQKKIVIGRGGEKMKQIGKAARLDLEKFLSKKVFLKLWVKTLENWKTDQAALRRLGYQ